MQRCNNLMLLLLYYLCSYRPNLFITSTIFRVDRSLLTVAFLYFTYNLTSSTKIFRVEIFIFDIIKKMGLSKKLMETTIKILI